tara:strand:- start:23369 stop:24112 length:744 start_codon:yes stop_codon:yes gene_type:complete
MPSREIEEFEVKCIEPGKSIQLFKGQIYTCFATYEVKNWRTSNANARTGTGIYKIRLKNISNDFPIENFTLPHGGNIPREDNRVNLYKNRLHNQENIIENKVICVTNKLKTLMKGKLYHISDVVYRGHAGVSNRYIEKIKLKENDRWYSNWHFELVPVDVNRNLEIEDLLGEGDSLKELTTYENNLSNEEKIHLVLESIVDATNYRNKTNISLSLMEIIKKRSLNKKGLEISDFDILKKLELSKYIN